MEESTIYSRWLRKELTEQEMAELKASGDLEVLEKIISETDTWSLPAMSKDSYRKLQEKIHSKKFEDPKIVSINRPNYWAYGIAASLALVVLSVYFIFFFPNTLTYQCQAGQQLKISLPDKTEVILTGQSSISINEKSFSENREVKLTGQGYFEVNQKGNFKVEFDLGKVKVLGTKFTILSGKDLTSVQCYEGKVSVSTNENKEEILTAGKGVRLMDGSLNSFEFKSEKPDWINGESFFKESPLAEVLNALAIQYNVEFLPGQTDLKRNYTGKFVHNDLKLALDMVFTPMNISYKLDDSVKGSPKVILN